MILVQNITLRRSFALLQGLLIDEAVDSNLLFPKSIGLVAIVLLTPSEAMLVYILLRDRVYCTLSRALRICLFKGMQSD